VPGFFLAKPLRAERGVVSQTFANWNHVAPWLKCLEAMRQAA
jgi:hypothetical protein